MLLIDMNINRKAPTTQPRSATAAGMEISSNHQTSLWFGFMEWRCGACWPCDLWWFRAWWALMIFDVILTPFRCHVSTGSILAVPHHPNSLIGVSWHRNRFCPIPTSLPVPVFFLILFLWFLWHLYDSSWTTTNSSCEHICFIQRYLFNMFSGNNRQSGFHAQIFHKKNGKQLRPSFCLTQKNSVVIFSGQKQTHRFLFMLPLIT